MPSMLYKKDGEEMINWVNRLDLKDLWKAKDEGKLTIQELGKQVARRIRKMPVYKKYEEELEDIAIQFEFVDEDVEVFDDILSELYDWADMPLSTPLGQIQRKMCWVATF